MEGVVGRGGFTLTQKVIQVKFLRKFISAEEKKRRPLIDILPFLTQPTYCSFSLKVSTVTWGIPPQ